MNSKIITVLLLSIVISLPLSATPEPVVIDTTQNKTRTKHIKAAHDVIAHNYSLDQIRFILLQATLSDKSSKWLMEEDGDSYFIVRWDHNNEVLYAKVEYNKKYVQLKYVDRKSSYECINNIKGICYKNDSSDFYEHFERLRELINKLIVDNGVEK